MTTKFSFIKTCDVTVLRSMRLIIDFVNIETHLLFTYLSSWCLAAHKAVTVDRQPSRLDARVVILPQVHLCPFMSLSSPLRHVSVGRPLLLCPWGVHLRAVFGSSCAPILSKRYINAIHLFFFALSETDV